MSNKFEVSTAFRFWANRMHGTDRRMECNNLSVRYKCTLAAGRQTSNNVLSLLVLCVVLSQRCAMYIILAVFEG